MTVAHPVLFLGRWVRWAPSLALVISACASSAPPSRPDAASHPDSAADVYDPLGSETFHRRISLGSATTGSDGVGPALSFEVPAQATSFVLTVRGAPNLIYTLAALEGPGGTIIVPKNWLELSKQPWLCLGPCQNRIAAEPSIASFLVPNTPKTPWQTGTYTLRTYAFEHLAGAHERSPKATDVEVAVELVAKPPAWQVAGRVDLNICLSGYAGITAAIAPQHPRIQDALATISELYAQAHISLGEVRFFDIETDTMIFTHDDGSDHELGDLFAKGQDLPLGINVFLVDAIQVTSAIDTGSALVMGLAGGIPGPPLEVGTRRSGVVVSLRPSGGPDLLGRIIAHEVGHFLGLFHTTEQSSTGTQVVYDTLADTPENDTANLMHWLESTNSFTLTPDQAGVMHANPWVTPMPAP